MVHIVAHRLLAAALLRVAAGAHGAPGAQGAPPAHGGPVLVRLRKLHPALPTGADAEAAQKSLYVGHLSVGSEPQRLSVIFDTASGQVIMPSFMCRSPACVERRRYVPQVSATATDINANGRPIQPGLRLASKATHRDSITIGFSSAELGDGKVVGGLLWETMCLGTEKAVGGRPCTELGIVAATEMTDAPFVGMPHDGVIGLGLRGLSIGPTFNFLEQFAAQRPSIRPQFAVYMGAKAGELALGGHNPARLAAPLTWSQLLRPEEGYWQLRILGVRVGNTTVAACRDGCWGIIDSSASRLGVPAALASGFEVGLSAGPAGCHGPPLMIELEGMTLVLRAEDYADIPACEAQVVPLHLPEGFAGAFILGQPVLRRYYAVFDAEAKRIGFGLAATVAGEEPEEEELGVGVELPAGVRVGPEVMTEGSGMNTLLLQVLAMQSIVVLLLSLASTYVKPVQLLLARLSHFLSRSGLLPRDSGPVADVPKHEVPEGCECVICLGCCDEDRHSAGGTGGGGRGGEARQPRWCRLACGHHFHEECIFEWLWKSPRCPICRSHVLQPSASPLAWGRC